MGVDAEGCLASPAVAHSARHLRKLHAGTKKRRHDEVTEPVQMDLLVETDAIPQGSEPAAG